MSDFLNRMLGRNSSEEKGSGATAKDRLKMVLTHDRIQVSPEKLNEMRTEIIAVIAKYVPEIDPNSVDISIEQTDRYNNRIVAQIPFSKTRGTSSPVVEENADLEDSVSFDATTLPNAPEDKVQEDTLIIFNPDDDEDTLLIARANKDDKTLPALNKDLSEADTTTVETVSDAASDDDSDSSDDD